MHYMNTLFSQLLKVIPRYSFERAVKRHNSDFRVRELRSWDQFLAMLFSQLTNRRSLRDLEMNFNSHSERFYHLGCHSIHRSTLADANNKRPVALYEEMFSKVLEKFKGKTCSEGRKLVHLMDATVIILNKTRFGWALGHKNKSGVKIHTVYDLEAKVPVYFSITNARVSDIKVARKLDVTPGATYVFDKGYYDFEWWNNLDKSQCKFVTRLKSNSPTYIVKQRKNESKNIISDNEIHLSKRLSRSRKNPYEGRLRKVIVRVEGKEKPLILVTNDMKKTADEIAELYKKRWQIELFFKWIKQNLKIKSFLGTTINAVKIQVITAMISYLLLRLMHATLPVELSVQILARLIQTNIMSRKTLIHLIKPPPIKAKYINSQLQLEAFYV